MNPPICHASSSCKHHMQDIGTSVSQNPPQIPGAKGPDSHATQSTSYQFSSAHGSFVGNLPITTVGGIQLHSRFPLHVHNPQSGSYHVLCNRYFATTFHGCCERAESSLVQILNRVGPSHGFRGFHGLHVMILDRGWMAEACERDEQTLLRRSIFFGVKIKKNAAEDSVMARAWMAWLWRCQRVAKAGMVLAVCSQFGGQRHFLFLIVAFFVSFTFC